MEMDSLFTGTKWQILELLSSNSLSPLEIAKRLNTSIANISQQLRLLETAGIVFKKKTGKNAPGKPRSLFFISNDFALITIISKNLTKKSFLKISKKQLELLNSIK